MIKIYNILSGIVFLSIGLIGIFIGHIQTLIQLDLYQSIIYLALGFWGVSVGLIIKVKPAQRAYINTSAYTMMALLLLGLTLPNFLDLVHLEPVEHVFHAVMFVTATLANASLSKF